MIETIKIKGMHCQNCVNKIESSLKELGVQKVKVDLAKDSATIEFDETKISLIEIKDKITNLGYNQENKKKGFWSGLMYGLIPHTGCIAFIIASILGVTVLMNVFKPLLMNRYFFYALIGLSLGFATLSSVLYLRKNKLLSWNGIKKKKGYLSAMYGSTVGINILLFFLIFPLLANFSLAAPETVEGLSELSLSVDIPCPGHAPLISSELKTLPGVQEVQFSFPNDFVVKYDASLTTEAELLDLGVFKEYPAKVTED